jgi:hypothetical protein
MNFITINLKIQNFNHNSSHHHHHQFCNLKIISSKSLTRLAQATIDQHRNHHKNTHAALHVSEKSNEPTVFTVNHKLIAHQRRFFCFITSNVTFIGHQRARLALDLETRCTPHAFSCVRSSTHAKMARNSVCGNAEITAHHHQSLCCGCVWLLHQVHGILLL